ncbi:MAG TPA: ATP-binding protein [Candidatus Dormibacteraeota bacterium]|nr:ATP-binding protein [Candidatus Dormibacteraeota bacterium]
MIDVKDARPAGSTARFFVVLVLLMLGTGIEAFHVIAKHRAIFIRSLDARVDVQRLVAATQDEATSLRGFAMTGDVVFRREYDSAHRTYVSALQRLENDLGLTEQAEMLGEVKRYDVEHSQWERDRGGAAPLDRMRTLAATIDAQLRRRSQWIAGVANFAIGGWVFVVVVLTAGFGALAVSSERRRLAQEVRLRADIASRNAALERSNQSLQEFAYVASHDLQEPLRTVASFTQLLQKRYAGKLDAQADEFIGFAVDGAKRMQQLINDILQYSRVTTHGKTFERVAIGSAVERAVTALQGRIAERSAAIVVLGGLPTVTGDPAQLSQLFLNLIGNAIKYNQDGHPRVEISARRDGGRWVLRVADNGIGIDPQYHEQIFRIFTRLHTRDEYEGTGIGLALCRRILERHRGRIWLESSEGSGTSVFFTLPAEIS